MSELTQLASQANTSMQSSSSIAVAKVVSNTDQAGLGRVQIKLRWNPSAALWARVAVPMAGSQNGSYFMPQVDDEVLVAFNQTDVTEAYVIGCLWSAPRRPPKTSPLDPKNVRVIRTPAGHELLFDDQQNLVSITTKTQQHITLAQDRIEVSAGNGQSTLTLGSSGQITIKASTSISIEAPNISINGSAQLDLKSSAKASLSGGGLCEVKAGLVKIN
ncbi:MAG: phage baseplate assembly protein V [Rhizobacter sp.]